MDIFINALVNQKKKLHEKFYKVNGAGARWALWYFRPVGACPPEWYNQPFVGQFKSHCFMNQVVMNVRKCIHDSKFATQVLRNFGTCVAFNCVLEI